MTSSKASFSLVPVSLIELADIGLFEIKFFRVFQSKSDHCSLNLCLDYACTVSTYNFKTRDFLIASRFFFQIK